MTAETFMPSVLTLTPSAVDKARVLIEEEGNAQVGLRVFVTGGGCSGFQYGFSFDEEQADDDTVINQDGIKVLVDALSYQYLVGAVVSYTEGLEGSRFSVTNPNASATCGCGVSFSI